MQMRKKKESGDAEGRVLDEVPAAPPPSEEKRSAQARRRLRRVLLLVGPLLVVCVGLYFYLASGRYVSTENAYVQADMVAVSAEVSGPIAEVAVDENEPVATGDVLFRIDAEPFRVALAHAEAALALARADIVSLKAAYRQKSEELQLAQTDEAFAEREFGRQRSEEHTSE